MRKFETLMSRRYKILKKYLKAEKEFENLTKKLSDIEDKAEYAANGYSQKFKRKIPRPRIDFSGWED